MSVVMYGIAGEEPAVTDNGAATADMVCACDHLLGLPSSDIPLICTQWDRMALDAPEAGPAIVAIVQRGLFALMACGDAPRARVAMAKSFVPDMNIYAVQRRHWVWSAAFIVRLNMVVDRLRLDINKGMHAEGTIYVFLNGRFEPRHFPRHITVPCTSLKVDVNVRYRRTNSRQEDMLRCFGKHSLQDSEFGCTPDGLAHYRYSHALSVVGTGRGVTDQAMHCGALHEFIERWMATLRPSSICIGSYRGLHPFAMRPQELWDMPDGHEPAMFPGFDEDRAMEWIPTRTVGREQRLLPLQLVNYQTAVNDPITPHRNSNGCSLGNSPVEAAFFAAMEVIERDALLLVWYARATPPRLDIDGIQDPRHRRLIDFIVAHGYRVACFDISNELDVPSILVLASGMQQGQLSDFVTAASHLDARVALHEALSEMKSLLLTAERNYRRNGAHVANLPQHVKQLLRYGDFEQRKHVDFLRDAPITRSYVDFCERYGNAPVSLYGAYRALRKKLAARDYRLIICDITHKMLPNLGLYAARAFIPGTIPLTFAPDPPWLPPQRLGRAAAHVAWLQGVTALSAAQPHPLG